MQEYLLTRLAVLRKKLSAAKEKQRLAEKEVAAIAGALREVQAALQQDEES